MRHLLIALAILLAPSIVGAAGPTATPYGSVSWSAGMVNAPGVTDATNKQVRPVTTSNPLPVNVVGGSGGSTLANQGTPGTSTAAWPVNPVVAGTIVSGTNPLPVLIQTPPNMPTVSVNVNNTLTVNTPTAPWPLGTVSVNVNNTITVNTPTAPWPLGTVSANVNNTITVNTPTAPFPVNGTGSGMTPVAVSGMPGVTATEIHFTFSLINTPQTWGTANPNIKVLHLGGFTASTAGSLFECNSSGTPGALLSGAEAYLSELTMGAWLKQQHWVINQSTTPVNFTGSIVVGP